MVVATYILSWSRSYASLCCPVINIYVMYNSDIFNRVLSDFLVNIYVQTGGERQHLLVHCWGKATSWMQKCSGTRETPWAGDSKNPSRCGSVILDTQESTPPSSCFAVRSLGSLISCELCLNHSLSLVLHCVPSECLIRVKSHCSTNLIQVKTNKSIR